MIKNKQWSLYKTQIYPKYPSVTYFWVDENDIVQFQRDISPIGYMPIELESIVGEKKNSLFEFKKVNHKMTQEELKKGWLLL
jgi:hypothetical protein